MSFYNIEDPEKLIPCPYDPLHMIRVKRFAYHLDKCAKVNKHIKLETCPFNARHRVPPSELQHHKVICNDRILINQDLVQAQTQVKQTRIEPQRHVNAPSSLYDTEENWDVETGDRKATFDDIKDLSGMSTLEKQMYYRLVEENTRRMERGLPPLEKLDIQADVRIPARGLARPNHLIAGPGGVGRGRPRQDTEPNRPDNPRLPKTGYMSRAENNTESSSSNSTAPSTSRSGIGRGFSVGRGSNRRQNPTMNAIGRGSNR